MPLADDLDHRLRQQSHSFVLFVGLATEDRNVRTFERPIRKGDEKVRRMDASTALVRLRRGRDGFLDRKDLRLVTEGRARLPDSDSVHELEADVQRLVR